MRQAGRLMWVERPVVSERQPVLRSLRLLWAERPVFVSRQDVQASRLTFAGQSAFAEQLTPRTSQSGCAVEPVFGLRRPLEIYQMSCVAMSIEFRHASRAGSAELCVAE
jgi:hypothetical protein